MVAFRSTLSLWSQCSRSCRTTTSVFRRKRYHHHHHHQRQQQQQHQAREKNHKHDYEVRRNKRWCASSSYRIECLHGVETCSRRRQWCASTKIDGARELPSRGVLSRRMRFLRHLIDAPIDMQIDSPRTKPVYRTSYRAKLSFHVTKRGITLELRRAIYIAGGGLYAGTTVVLHRSIRKRERSRVDVLVFLVREEEE